MRKIKDRLSELSRRISIKWNVFFTFLSFSGILLLVLWVMQILLLDNIYSYIKTEKMKTNVENIMSCLEEDDYVDLLDDYTRANDLNLMIIDENFSIHHSRMNSPVGKLADLRNQLAVGEKYEISTIYDDTANSENGETSAVYSSFGVGSRHWAKTRHVDFTGDGENSLSFSVTFPRPFGESAQNPDDGENAERGENGFDGENARPPEPPEGYINRTLIYTKIITFSDGVPGLIMIESLLTPVNATVDTLSAIFGIIAVVMIIISLMLAFAVSVYITKPIAKINDSAKLLSKGDYSVKFTGGGYKEIAQLNDTLNFTAAELSRVENLRKELIANVSHDLRTPLTMIVGYAEVMRDIPGENNPENVQVIIDEAERLSSLVNDLLDNSRLQSGRMPFKKTPYDLTESIRSIVERYDKMAAKDGFEIRFESDGADICIDADEDRISQVICNLINNAINYSGENKSVTVRLQAKGRYARVEVEDTGIGISKEDLPYIWDRYYKVDKTHKRAQVGTGLGLSIVKSLLELHNARYGVTSTVGVGSVFWFEIERIRTN